ncbi:MAG: endonuclease III [Thermoanaerobaculales bacterium]|nr:endonuclease III [Thermoanaerobaculales bacterium]
MKLETRAATFAELLAGEYPDAATELDYGSPWQLLVATVLSAQCTDVRVNKVTPELFARWPHPEDLASASQEDVESVIRSTGMFRQKASSLRSVASIVASDHGGRVPEDLDALVALPGVGRKTAKVVLGEAFGIAAGVTVDTHVRRLARRLGLTRLEDPEKIAAELESLLPREEWIKFSTRLILHGRRVCSARFPRCDECVLAEGCPRVGV